MKFRVLINFCFLFFATAINNAHSSDSLSYSGRLVQSNGAPVAGPVNLKIDLAYSNTPGTILCSQNFTNVNLSKGVFHLKIDFNCGANGTLEEVLAAVPAGESAAIKVTDVTNPASPKDYSFQALHSMPFAQVAGIAKQLMQLGASDGQFLKWNNTNKKWEPGAVSGASGGTVTNVSTNAPLSIVNATSTPTISIDQANTTTSGYISSADWNTFNSKQGSIVAGTTAQFYRGDKTWQTLDTSVVPENVNLYFTNARALGVPLTSFTTATGAIVATDTILEAFGKTQGQINLINSAANNFLIKNSTDSITGLVNVGTTGLLQLVYTPVGMNDATNKAYVDSEVGTRISKSGDTMSGVLTLDNDLRVKGGSNYVTIKGHATSSTYNLTLPQTTGSSNQVLTTDGSGATSWTTIPTSTTPSGAAGGDLAGTYPNPTLNSSTLNALKTYNTNGILVQTAANTFAGRSVVGTLNRIAISNGNGGAGNPTIDLDSTLLPSPVAGDAGKFLKASGANASAWTTLGSSDITTALGFTPVNKAGDTISTGTFTFSGTSVLRALDPVGVNDVATKQYVDSYGQWIKSGSDIYRASGNVGVGTISPGYKIDVQDSDADVAINIQNNDSISGDHYPGVYITNHRGATDQGGTPELALTNRRGTSAAPVAVVNGDVLGLISLWGRGASTDVQGVAIRAIAQETFTNATAKSAMTFNTTASGAIWPNEKMRIDGGGNVGIGTTTPQSKLDVNGSVRLGADATACSATIAGAMRFNTPNVEYCNGTAWTVFNNTGAGTVGTSQITDGSIVNADVSATANIDATKLGTGVVDNTEFNYLNGVTSSIQTQIGNKQPLDATLTSLAAFSTNGILVQTAADTFTGRSIAGTSNRLTVTNGDGVSGNPTINLDTSLLPSPIAGDAGKFLKASGANASAWSALASSDITTALGFTPINKAGDTVSAGTFNFNGSAVIRTLDPILPTDVVTKQYVDGFGQWTKSGSDIYRSSGNVGVGTSTPTAKLDIAGNLSLNASDYTWSSNISLPHADATAGKKALLTLPAVSQNSRIIVRGVRTTNDGAHVFDAEFKVAVTSGTAQFRIVEEKVANTVATFDWYFDSATGTPYLRFGQVGNSYTYSVTVISNAPNQPTVAVDSGSAPAFPVVNSEYAMRTTVNDDFLLYTNGTERMRVNSSGNVGIGTATPSNVLHLNNGAGEEGSPGIFIQDPTASSAYGGSLYYEDRSGANALKLSALENGVESGFLALERNSGKVGIGTTNPLFKFHVDGNSAGSGEQTVAQFGTNLAGAGPLYLTYNAPFISGNLYFNNGWKYGGGTAKPGSIGLAGGISFQTDDSAVGAAGATASGLSTKMFIATNGYVGIGITPTYLLHLGSDSAAKPGTSTWIIASDERLKDVRAPFTRGLDDLMGLNTIYFKYKENNALDLPSEKEYVGIKAQDAKKVIPEAVSRDDKGYLHVSNDPIIWTAVNAIKELYKKFMGHDEKLIVQSRQIASKADKVNTELKIKSLENENEKLKRENAEIKARLDRIEKSLKNK